MVISTGVFGRLRQMSGDERPALVLHRGRERRPRRGLVVEGGQLQAVAALDRLDEQTGEHRDAGADGEAARRPRHGVGEDVTLDGELHWSLPPELGPGRLPVLRGEHPAMQTTLVADGVTPEEGVVPRSGRGVMFTDDPDICSSVVLTGAVDSVDNHCFRCSEPVSLSEGPVDDGGTH
jgi:hypothetical protein